MTFREKLKWMKCQIGKQKQNSQFSACRLRKMKEFKTATAASALTSWQVADVVAPVTVVTVVTVRPVANPSVVPWLIVCGGCPRCHFSEQDQRGKPPEPRRSHGKQWLRVSKLSLKCQECVCRWRSFFSSPSYWMFLFPSSVPAAASPTDQPTLNVHHMKGPPLPVHSLLPGPNALLHRALSTSFSIITEVWHFGIQRVIGRKKMLGDKKRVQCIWGLIFFHFFQGRNWQKLQSVPWT